MDLSVGVFSKMLKIHMIWRETRVSWGGIGQLLWFATCCSVGSQLCILGSSEITGLCPGACAACLLATFWVSGDLLSLLSGLLWLHHLLGLAQHSYVTDALMKVVGIFLLACLPFDLHCRIRSKLSDCDNSCFPVGCCNHKGHKMSFFKFNIKI